MRRPSFHAAPAATAHPRKVSRATMTVPKKAKAEEVSEEEEVKELSPEEEKALSELQTIHDEVEKVWLWLTGNVMFSILRS